MLFLKHAPMAPISEFVAYLWLLSDAPPHAKESILPTGTLELVINLREDQIRIYDDAGTCRRFSGTIISGAYSRPFMIDTREHALTMGVHFRPGGAFPFTRAAPGELADGHVDVEMLWGSRAAELRERLCSAVTHRERFQVLERALFAQVMDSRRGHPAVQSALQRLRQRRASVREIVASIGLSHRHFASLFRDEVGMTPKLFLRVQRFQRTIAIAQKCAFGDWAGLASACGYYDQAHMIRDFAEFADCTPGAYLRQRSDRLKDHHLLLG
jgi:AraC-like DNA-binding protein